MKPWSHPKRGLTLSVNKANFNSETITRFTNKYQNVTGHVGLSVFNTTLSLLSYGSIVIYRNDLLVYFSWWSHNAKITIALDCVGRYIHGTANCVVHAVSEWTTSCVYRIVQDALWICVVQLSTFVHPSRYQGEGQVITPHRYCDV